jgi:hypothetical protein
LERQTKPVPGVRRLERVQALTAELGQSNDAVPTTSISTKSCPGPRARNTEQRNKKCPT